MWFRAEWVSLEVGVGHVTDCFGHRTEGRRRLHPSHGGGEGDRHELGFAFVPGEDEGQVEAVESPQEHAVEGVLDVLFVGSYGAEFRICVAD